MEMADNDTFRYLGGSACSNLFGVHVRMGVYDQVGNGPRLLDLRPSSPEARAFFGLLLGAQTKHKKSSKTLVKHLVFAT